MSTMGYVTYVLRILAIIALVASAILVRSRNKGSAMASVFCAGTLVMAAYDAFNRVAYFMFPPEVVHSLMPALRVVDRAGLVLMLIAILPNIGLKRPSMKLRIAVIGFAVLEAARSTPQFFLMNSKMFLFLFFVEIILVALLFAGSLEKGDAAGAPAISTADHASGASGFNGANRTSQNAAPQSSPKTVQARTLARYDEQRDYCEGLAAVRSGNQWGFIDQSGNVVVQPQFAWVSDYSEGFAAVCDDSTYQGYIDREGHYLVKPKYGFAKPFRHGLGEVKLDMKYGIVDTTGKEIIPLKYDDVNIYEGGFVITELSDMYGLYNKTGKELLKPQYDEIGIEGSVATYTDHGTKKELRL